MTVRECPHLVGKLAALSTPWYELVHSASGTASRRMFETPNGADVDLLLLQFDIHSPANTVYEALNFSSELRLEGVDKKQRKAFVDEVCR